MKQLWSSKWKSSIQPRKQRKFRHNAPLHIRHKLVSANLSPAMRREFGRRSMPLRKGDEVEVMRGSFRELRGVVERTDLKACKVYVDKIKIKKVDGSEVLKALEPSNLRITKMGLEDKRRQRALERSPRKERKITKESPRKVEKPEKKEPAKKEKKYVKEKAPEKKETKEEK